MPEDKEKSIIKYKLLYTAIILLVYLVGKEIPLYMIDISTYMNKSLQAEDLLFQTISGDVYRCSVFALGISPLMISGVIVQIISVFRNSEQKSKLSPKRQNNIMLTLTVIIALIQAVIHVGELQFAVQGRMLISAQIIATIELVTGAVVIMNLTNSNKKYGIGGQSVLVLVNVIDSLKTTLDGQSWAKIVLPLCMAILVMMVTLMMENTEKRIPVQRISIHNIYADKNYIPIKFNPIGVMPAMFSTAFFMIPQLVVKMLLWIMPTNAQLMWWQDNMSLNKPLGIFVYVLVLYILTMGFSRVFLNPGELTEQFLKSGDSLQDIHAGRETKKYLSRSINMISFLSATVMSVCLLIPMMLQAGGYIDSSLSTLPTMAMMLMGIWCNIHREYRAVKDLEAYKPFI